MNFVALVNPIAGQGAATQLWDRIALELMGAGLDVRTIKTRSREHTIETAIQEAGSGNRVVAVGGDGMVRDVAAGVVKAAGTMAIVPAGRGNDLAQRLGLPFDLPQIVAMLLVGPTRVIDVLDVNGQVVPGNAYVGVDSVAARIINEQRGLPATVVYRAAGVAAVMKWKPTAFTLEYEAEDGRPITRVVRAHDIVFANSGQYGHGLNIVPSARVDDGLIDVLIVRHGPRYRIGRFLLAAKQGTHVERDDVEVFRTSRIDVDADRDVPFGADGDEVTALPATIRVRPKALRLLAAPDTRDTQRPQT